jgi:hypothetical protein
LDATVQRFDTRWFHGHYDFEEWIGAHSRMLHEIRDQCFLYEEAAPLQHLFQRMFELCLNISTVLTEIFQKGWTEELQRLLESSFHRFKEHQSCVINTLKFMAISSLQQESSSFLSKKSSSSMNKFAPIVS